MEPYCKVLPDNEFNALIRD